MFQFSHRNLWILFFQPLNHDQGRVITPAFPKSWKLWTISIVLNQFPKVPCNSMGPVYFNIRTPVFNKRTLDSTYIEFDYVK